MKGKEKIINLELQLVEEIIKQSDGNLILFFDLSSKVLKSLKKAFSEIIDKQLRELLGEDYDLLVF